MFENNRDIDDEIFYDNIVPDHKTSTDSDVSCVKQPPKMPDIINNIEEIENFFLNKGMDIFGITDQLKTRLEKMWLKLQIFVREKK